MFIVQFLFSDPKEDSCAFSYQPVRLYEIILCFRTENSKLLSKIIFITIFFLTAKICYHGHLMSIVHLKNCILKFLVISDMFTMPCFVIILIDNT